MILLLSYWFLLLVFVIGFCYWFLLLVFVCCLLVMNKLAKTSGD